MKIYLIRHGQTAWNKISRWQGTKDVELDELGIEQARGMAEKLLSFRINKIYASPLKRAAVTAEILREKTGVDIVYRQELREVCLGEWEGSTTAEIIAKHGGLFELWDRNPTAQIGLGVENMSELQARAYKELIEIACGETDDFAIVSHGAWIKCLMCKLLSISLENKMCFEIGNTGINVIEYSNREGIPKFTVITLNDVSHLYIRPLS